MGTTVKVSARLLTWLLAVAAAAVLVLGAWPTLVGPDGLDLGRGMVPTLSPQPEIHLTVVPGDDFDQRWAATAPAAPHNLFPWKDTSNGTRDAITGRPPVELFLWASMDLGFAAPTGADRLSYAGPRLAGQALVLLVLWLLWRIVRTVSVGEVFTAANARRIVGIGLAVAGGGSALQLLGYAAHKGMLARSAAEGIIDVAFSFSFLPLVAGAIILLLAEVFRQGVQLRAELAGVV